jgi:hypothetical protein
MPQWAKYFCAKMVTLEYLFVDSNAGFLLSRAIYSGDPESELSNIRDILIQNFFKFGLGMVYTILKPDIFVRF